MGQSSWLGMCYCGLSLLLSFMGDVIMPKMRKAKDWYVVIEWDDGTTEKLIGYDFAPDVAGYLSQFILEVEQYRNESEV